MGDSLIKRLDNARYARKFTPRKPDSKWSTVNRKRYAKLKAGGRLMPAGLQRTPTDRIYGPKEAVGFEVVAVHGTRATEKPGRTA